MIGKARLTYEELNTVLIEVELVINTRPLTYLYSDEITEPITPSHLLVGRNLNAQLSNTPSTVDISADGLGKSVLYLRTVLDHFWNRFSHTYLNKLREHYICCNRYVKTSEATSIKVDDVVVIKEDKMSPRSNWRTGRIEELVCGNDEQVRGAKIMTISKTVRQVKISRPVQKLIPLEVVRNETNVNENTSPKVTEAANLRCSTRKAAIEGEVRRKYRQGLSD